MTKPPKILFASYLRIFAAHSKLRMSGIKHPYAQKKPSKSWDFNGFVLGRQRDSEMCIPHGFTHNMPLKLKAVRTFALQQFLLCR